MCKFPAFEQDWNNPFSEMSDQIELDSEESQYEDEERKKEDIFLILVATDIHLGYAERDPVRSKDTFETFEEILKTARSKNVDLILLGGDLFHETRPSTYCLFKCVELLKKYCFGDRPIQIEYLSDPSRNFVYTGNDTVNYEDPNINISIPVFSIHGNHDDPTGEHQISAMNLLATAGLVNYFGRHTNYESVEIEPILLKKGQTNLAIYGLSHIKDERLARLFLDKKVTVMAPSEEDYFHLLVLHQNRANRGVKTFIPDSLLPDILDLAIWGHEHDCQIDPEQSANSVFISQPGSSVATSLSSGETIPKHIGLLEIHKKQFHMTPIPLKTVRPFVYKELTLNDPYSLRREIAGVDDEGLSNQVIAERMVEQEIEDMIRKSTQLGLEGNKLPLLRLIVTYVDESQAFNMIRFGQRYVGRVANPKDMVKLKSGLKPEKTDTTGIGRYMAQENINLPNRVEDLVLKYFEDNPEDQLQCLSLKTLNESVVKCIDTQELEAPVDVTNSLIKERLKKLKESDVNLADKNIENFLFSVKDDEDDSLFVDNMLKASSGGKKPAQNRNADVICINEDSESDSEVRISPVRGVIGRGGTPTRPARGPGSRGGRGSRGRNRRGRR
ncbi:double-strand break repair protein MRE11 [Euwallacea similis]|uniref:double-strand break repair protein MRE11 n=1 Tax=Euwallacea similis TaxID=1736056 RepID=UPI00344EAE17